VQEIRGEDARWSDSEYLMAMIGDSVAHLGWMFARVNAKNAPKRPPQPIRRPGDVSNVPGLSVNLNISERTSIVVGALFIDELDVAVANQTGAAQGIAGGG